MSVKNWWIIYGRRQCHVICFKLRKSLQKVLHKEEFWQVPCCGAAINGCHIPMKCPPKELQSFKEYCYFKNFYSIVLMGMVDLHYRFVWGSCGFPGNSMTQIFSDRVTFGQVSGLIPEKL